MKFEDYVFEFYGPGKMYGDFFNNNLMREEIRLAIALRQRNNDVEFCGDECDSFDREIIRDIMLRLRGANDTEYNVESYFKDFFFTPNKPK